MKLKTHRGLKKRVKVNAKKKIFFKKGCKNHLLSNKSSRQKDSCRMGMAAHPSNVKYLNKLLHI